MGMLSIHGIMFDIPRLLIQARTSFDIYQTSNLRITSSVFVFVRLSVIHCITTAVFLVAFKSCFTTSAFGGDAPSPSSISRYPTPLLHLHFAWPFTLLAGNGRMCFALVFCVSVLLARNTYDKMYPVQRVTPPVVQSLRNGQLSVRLPSVSSWLRGAAPGNKPRKATLNNTVRSYVTGPVRPWRIYPVGCGIVRLFTSTMILAASRVSSFHALRSARCAYAGRRFLQTTPPAGANSVEAYLEPNHDHPGIVSLLLNRPKSKNAISLRLLKELQECLDTVQFDKTTRVLIVRSSTVGSFCAGADLVERATMTKAQVDRFLIDLRRALGTLENLPMPTIAAIDGPALGGGLEMGLACDLRVAGHAVTKIGLPETKLGIIPGAGGTQRLTRLLGMAKAKDLIFTARVMTAQQAHEIGVVDYVSTPETAGYDRALQLAGEISTSAPLALRAAKQAISRVPDLGFESGLDFERASYEPLLHSKDRTEALKAFKEKRAPVFKGE